MIDKDSEEFFHFCFLLFFLLLFPLFVNMFLLPEPTISKDVTMQIQVGMNSSAQMEKVM